MVRVSHHDPEHGGSIFLTILSLSMGRKVRVRQAHPTLKYPEEDREAVSLSNRLNRFMIHTALYYNPRLIRADFAVELISERGYPFGILEMTETREGNSA